MFPGAKDPKFVHVRHAVRAKKKEKTSYADFAFTILASCFLKISTLDAMSLMFNYEAL